MSTLWRLGTPSGQAAVQLAVFLSDPLAFLPMPLAKSAVAGILDRDLSALIDLPFARRAIGRHLRGIGALGEMPVEEAALQALLNTDGGRWTVSVALSPLDTLEHINRQIAAAICQDQIRGLLLKSDRQALAGLLGAQAAEFATRGAQMFYPTLATLAEASGGLALGWREEERPHPLLQFSSCVIGACLDQQAPLAGQICRLRLGGGDTGAGLDLSEAQQQEVKRLISSALAT